MIIITVSYIDLLSYKGNLTNGIEWYTASSIRMGSPYQSDSMRCACDVCEGIRNGMILNFSYYCKYRVLVFGDDGTGPADESKRTKRVQGWSRQIMGEGFFIICNTITL